MSLAATVAAMAASGCTAEQISAVVEADEAGRRREQEAKREDRREGNRRRQALRRELAAREVDIACNVGNAVTGGTDGEICNVSHAVTGPVTRDRPFPEVSPKENKNPFLPNPVESEGRASGRDLAVKAKKFYEAYPKKVDPQDAMATFIRIAKSGVDPDRIIAAAERFAAAHRLAATPKQFIRAPAVWLNRGSYDSEDLPEARAGPLVNGSHAPPSNGSISNGTYKQTPSDFLREQIARRAGLGFSEGTGDQKLSSGRSDEPGDAAPRLLSEAGLRRP